MLFRLKCHFIKSVVLGPLKKNKPLKLQKKLLAFNILEVLIILFVILEFLYSNFT